MREGARSGISPRCDGVKYVCYFRRLKAIAQVWREALAGGKKPPNSAPSVSVFFATPRRKLHFRLFKMPLRRCLREPVG